MKLLFVSPSFRPALNGVAEVGYQVARNLVCMGHDVRVITSTLSGEESESIVDGIKVTRIPIGGNFVRGLFGQTDQYRRLIENTQRDVALFHCAQTWTVDALIKQRLRSDKNILISHGLSEFRNPVYQNYYRNLSDFLAKNSFEVIGLSDSLEEPLFLKENKLRPPYIIPNGIAKEEWSRAPQAESHTGAVGRRPWLISVSNHDPAKNHKLFYRIVRQTRESVGNLDATIFGRPHVCGRSVLRSLRIKGGCWYRCAIESRLAGVKLRANASRNEVVYAMRRADLVLITSKREAYPVVALEAMAAGTPWISQRVGAIAEIPGGFVFDSEEEMIEKTIAILQSSETRKFRRSYDIPCSFFWENISSKYEAVIKSVFYR